jgi:hypothetical protein
MNATEHAAKIRAELKRKGWNARQISVKVCYFSMGSEIIAKRAENIRRCEITGEILDGSNCYVSVAYTNNALTIIGRRYADAVQRAVNQLPEGNTSALIPIEGTPFFVGRRDWTLTLWSETSYICDASDIDSVARAVGLALCSRSSGDYETAT